jgi:hypothetical protein
MLRQVVLCAEWLVTRITREFLIWLALLAQMFHKHKFSIIATETHVTAIAGVSLVLLEWFNKFQININKLVNSLPVLGELITPFETLPTLSAFMHFWILIMSFQMSFQCNGMTQHFLANFTFNLWTFRGMLDFLVVFQTGLGHEVFITQFTGQIPVLLIFMNNKEMSVSILLVYKGFSTDRAKGKSSQDVMLENPVNFAQEDTARHVDKAIQWAFLFNQLHNFIYFRLFHFGHVIGRSMKNAHEPSKLIQGWFHVNTFFIWFTASSVFINQIIILLYWWHVRIWLGVGEQLSEKQNSKKKLFFKVHVASLSKQFCYPVASNMLSNQEISNSNLSSFKRLRFMKVILISFNQSQPSSAVPVSLWLVQ